MAQPKVSVLMSVYNGQAYLAQAMESILSQSLAEFEFIIIDDGSSDDTRKIIQGFEDRRIRLLVNPDNLGLTRSLNIGLAEARGDYLARQDADDISLPPRLAWQAEYLDRHHEAVAVAGSAEYLDQAQGSVRADGRFLGPGSVRWSLLFGNELPHGAMMLRRRAVQEVGGYDESFPVSQDYELWSRLAQKGDLVRLARILIRYRRHGQAISGARRGDQDRFRDRVSRANMERLLGRSVEPELVRALRTRERRPGACLEAGRLVADLWRAFQGREAMDPQEKRAVRRQAGGTMRGLAGLYYRTLPLEAGLIFLRSWRLGSEAG